MAVWRVETVPPFDLGPLIVGIIIMSVMIGISVGVLIGFAMILGGIIGIPMKLLLGEYPVSWMAPPKMPRRKRDTDDDY
jgi:hypothetical protein